MLAFTRTAMVMAGLVVAAHASAQVTFYEGEGFQGRSFTTRQQVGDFERFGFNDRASSAVVTSNRWEVCDNTRFNGRCVVLRPGRYPSLAAMGINDRASSVRAVSASARIDDNRYAPLPMATQVTVYEREGFQGRSFSTEQPIGNVDRSGLRDRAGSIVVTGAPWEVCEDVRFGGKCVVLRPGRYPSLAAVGVSDHVASVRAVTPEMRASVAPQVTFYESEGFQGRSFTTQQQVGNFDRTGFNDRASSVEVVGAPWEVCQDAGFNGRCMVLRPGRYPSLSTMGLNDRISSVRTMAGNVQIDDNRYAPAPGAATPAPAYAYRRRNEERVYDAPVTSVRAVVGTPEQRCWVEREQVVQDRGNANVPGAVVGAVIGGILGHQVGGGRGKDFATVGGAVAGGAIGANVGRSGGPATQDVQRCTTNSSPNRPDYWDVTYSFRGQEHRLQMTTPPGQTVLVNESGEPRS